MKNVELVVRMFENAGIRWVFGIPVRGVRDVRAFQEALDWALLLNGPCIIEAFIDVQPYSLTVFDE